MTSRAPWLSHYDPGVPPSLEPYPSRTLLDFVSDAARAHTNSTALWFKGTAVTYGELERLSDDDGWTPVPVNHLVMVQADRTVATRPVRLTAPAA